MGRSSHLCISTSVDRKVVGLKMRQTSCLLEGDCVCRIILFPRMRADGVLMQPRCSPGGRSSVPDSPNRGVMSSLWGWHRMGFSPFDKFSQQNWHGAARSGHPVPSCDLQTVASVWRMECMLPLWCLEARLPKRGPSPWETGLLR